MRASAPAATFSELIVTVDGHPSDAVALAHARALAGRLGCPIILLRQVSRDGVGRATREEMELLADRVGDVDVRVRVVDGEQPAAEIVDFAKEHPRSVLCMATRAPSAAGQLLFGSVAVEVARRSPVPVLLVGPEVPIPGDSPPLSQVVACLDGSEAAERALGVAESLAAALEVPLRLCQAVVGHPCEATRFEWGYLATTVERLGGGSQLDWKLIHNADPASGLVGLTAGEGSALLVLATHARRVGRRFREGSVAMDVVSVARAPVLVIGPACRRTERHRAP